MIYYFIGKVAVRPRLIGKIATVFQMMAVIWALLKWDSSWLRNWIIGATLCTIASGLLYILDGVRQLSISRAARQLANWRSTESGGLRIGRIVNGGPASADVDFIRYRGLSEIAFIGYFHLFKKCRACRIQISMYNEH